MLRAQVHMHAKTWSLIMSGVTPEAYSKTFIVLIKKKKKKRKPGKPMIDMGFLMKRRRPLMPAYLLRQPADHSRTTYSVPKKSTSTISCGEQTETSKGSITHIETKDQKHTKPWGWGGKKGVVITQECILTLIYGHFNQSPRFTRWEEEAVTSVWSAKRDTEVA